MALPNPPTSANGSKLFAVTYDNAGTNAAAPAKSVKQTTVNAEVLGHMGVGTHKDTDTYASADPVVLVAAINGTDIVPLVCNASGHTSINDGGNSLTVDGTVGVSGTVTVATHAVTQSGTWNSTINVALPAGTATIGAALDGGWDTAGHAVSRGLQQGVAGDVTEKTLLAADASNLYNITDIVFTIYPGSTAPAAVRRLQFRLGVAGTVFHTEYIPPTANVPITRDIQFREPVRSTTNQAITVQLDAAGGTSYEYSAMVLAYKTAS
jgi:hypothetical protein